MTEDRPTEVQRSGPGWVLSAPLPGIAAAIAYLALYTLTYGLSYPLFSILQERQGLSSVFIGTSALLQGLGAIVVMPLAPAIFRRTELGQMLALATGLAAVCVLLMGALSDPWLWLGIRMILGAATAIAFFGAEHWIVAMAPNLHRSRIVAGYLVAFAVCFGVGPLVLAAVGVEGWPPFLIIAAILALASVPVFLMRRSAPRFRGEVHLSAVPRFALRYPVICLAVLLVAMIEICVLGLLPVWAVQSGQQAEASATLVAFAGFGGACTTLALGLAGDHLSHRRLMAIIVVVGVPVLLLIPGFSEVRWVLWLLVFVSGGTFMGLYMLALLELGARCSGRGELATGNAAVVMSYHTGAVFGPLYGGAVMDLFFPDALLYALASAMLVFLVVLARDGRRSTGNIKEG